MQRFKYLLALAAITPIMAESDLVSMGDSGYLTFYLDNDLFAGEDENYTNGSRISYITEGEPVINIPFIQKTLTRFSAEKESASWVRDIWGWTDPEEAEYSYGFALTQLMFTPTTLETSEPPPGERPYAGWLGVGFSLHVRDTNKLNSVEISLGTVGKYAFGEAAQDTIHEIRNLEKFQGWDSQIPNEPTLNLSFNQRRRGQLFTSMDLPMNLEIDGFYDNGYDIGNFLTAAHVGGTIRFGWNLPVEFSDPRLTLTAHSQRLYSQSGKNLNDWSVYAILGVRGSAILHDITLDGPVFRDYDTGVDKEVLVGEYYAGFGVRYQKWECGYVQSFRSKQFKSQSESQSFGSLALRRRF